MEIRIFETKTIGINKRIIGTNKRMIGANKRIIGTDKRTIGTDKRMNGTIRNTTKIITTGTKGICCGWQNIMAGTQNITAGTAVITIFTTIIINTTAKAEEKINPNWLMFKYSTLASCAVFFFSFSVLLLPAFLQVAGILPLRNNCCKGNVTVQILF
jgi:hypothetical protein